MTNFLDFILIVGLSLRIKCLKSHWFLMSIKLLKELTRSKEERSYFRVLKNFVKKSTVKYYIYYNVAYADFRVCLDNFGINFINTLTVLNKGFIF